MGRAAYRPKKGCIRELSLWLAVGSTSTSWLQTTVPSIPNARAVGPPTGRSTFFRPNFAWKRTCSLAQLGLSYYDPRTSRMALAVH
jgi:hypothetical protein